MAERRESIINVLKAFKDRLVITPQLKDCIDALERGDVCGNDIILRDDFTIIDGVMHITTVASDMWSVLFADDAALNTAINNYSFNVAFENNSTSGRLLIGSLGNTTLYRKEKIKLSPGDIISMEFYIDQLINTVDGSVPVQTNTRIGLVRVSDASATGSLPGASSIITFDSYGNTITSGVDEAYTSMNDITNDGAGEINGGNDANGNDAAWRGGQITIPNDGSYGVDEEYYIFIEKSPDGNASANVELAISNMHLVINPISPFDLPTRVPAWDPRWENLVGPTEEVPATAVTRSELDTMITNGDDITGVDVSEITNFSSLFAGLSTFNQDISAWDMSSALNTSSMFSSAVAFNQDLSGWDVSNVTNMSGMFQGATLFNWDISAWDVGSNSVTDMSHMFEYATSFNAPIGVWNVSSVTDMSRMFRGATAFNQPLNAWNTSLVNNMFAMFDGATAFNQDLSGWNVSNVTTMGHMFLGAVSFNGDVTTWVTTSLTNMWATFADINGNPTVFNQDISGWDVSNVTNFDSTFEGATVFNQNISTWATSAADTMGYMFKGAIAFNQDISTWDTSAVIYMADMFNNATLFNQDISGWDVSNVLYCTDIAAGTSGLTCGFGPIFATDCQGCGIVSVSCIMDSFQYDAFELFNDPTLCFEAEFSAFVFSLPVVPSPASFSTSFAHVYYLGQNIDSFATFMGWDSLDITNIKTYIQSMDAAAAGDFNTVFTDLQNEWYYSLDPVGASLDGYVGPTMTNGHPFLTLAYLYQSIFPGVLNYWTERCAWAAAGGDAIDPNAGVSFNTFYQYSVPVPSWLTVGDLIGYDQMGGFELTQSAGSIDNGDWGTCV